jgi:hypothetical protein
VTHEEIRVERRQVGDTAQEHRDEEDVGKSEARVEEDRETTTSEEEDRTTAATS